MKTLLQLCSLLLALLLAATLTFAQAPTGAISGTVFDESGAVVPNVQVTISRKDTGQVRTATTGADGSFSASTLPAGVYQVKVETAGFRTLLREATVEVGSTTTVDVHLQVGATKDVVNVESVTPLIEYDRHTIDGVVTRQQIDSLPLNGRSFLQLAMLEPGVSVSANSLGQYNRQFDVNIMGSGSESVRITVDGATVNDSVTGGTQQNFSQEIVQEFQVSSVNFDLSTGITAGGAVNVITRTGSNEFHGSGFYYFRDHNMSAYPYLKRDPLQPDPFFARRQPGFWVGGPVKKDKLFFFTNYEHSNQRGVFSIVPSSPEFSSFATNASTPYNQNLFGARIDYRISQKHTAFLRYGHDGNNSFSPPGNQLPSGWVANNNYADSGVFSVVSSLTPRLVNEFRYSMTYWSNTNNPPSVSQCPAPCIGLGGAQININGIGGFSIGNASNAPQSRVLRRHIFADNVTFQKGSHRLQFGGEWEYQKGTGTYAYADPASITVFSPQNVRDFNAFFAANGLSFLSYKLPTSFTTYADILQLPVAGFASGVGEIGQPPLFNRGNADHNNRFHFYAQDTWKVTPSFTLNYGLAHSYESNLLNHDYTKPQYLAPIFGANNLGQERHTPYNFSPSLGFAWKIGKDNKTVIRGGGGIYYDTMNLEVRLIERASLGPRGSGRQLLFDGFFFPTLSPLIGNTSLPAALQIKSLSDRPVLPLGQLLQLLPQLRAAVQAQIGPPGNTDLSVRNIEIFKTASQDLLPVDFRTPYSEHLSLGMQRELRHDLVLSADFVFRQFLHGRIRNTDLNHYNSFAGPVIPKCTGTQAADPKAQCSSGPFYTDIAGANSHYLGVLVKVDKRFSHRYLFTAAYAYSARTGYNGLIADDNWNASYGPQAGHQLLNISAIVDLPWGFKFSLVSAFASRGPFQPRISGIDLNGDGINGEPIPGGGYNEFAVSLGHADLARLVDQFNQTYGGKKTSRGQAIPTLKLPGNYSFGKNFNSQDVRITKDFKLFTERYHLSVFGECFNVFNLANLGGYSSTLQDAGFGQPTSRAGNIFGSGGPRAIQVGGRFTF